LIVDFIAPIRHKLCYFFLISTSTEKIKED
jgi:hypothetical protein